MPFFTVYSVFPGVELVFSSVHMDKCFIGINNSDNLIEIHHCKEGRMERVFEKEYFYISEGDLAIVKRSTNCLEFEFPLNHYHGATIVIKNDFKLDNFKYILNDINIKPSVILDNLCKNKNYYISRSEE